MKLLYHVTSQDLTPYRANPDDAGMDLFSSSTDILYNGESKMFDTGVSVLIPKGYVGLVFSRSSQGLLRVSLANAVGVVDSGYIGNIKVVLTNVGGAPYEVHRATTRIAQLVVMPIAEIEEMEQVQSWATVDVETARGAGGFGSSNV